MECRIITLCIQVEGPAAVDILVNFEERWKKQAPKDKKNRLLDIRGGELFDTKCPAPCEEGQEWDCQLFRLVCLLLSSSGSPNYVYDTLTCTFSALCHKLTTKF